MSDTVREAFLYYIPREQLDGQSAEDALLPLESIPAALERLLLDGDDDMALSVLSEAAEPLGRGRGVPYEPWKEVVQVLLDQRMVEDKELERVQRHVDAEQEGEQRQGPSRRRRQPTRAAAQAAQPVVMEEQSDSMEDDHQETYQGRRRRGLNKPDSDGEEEDDMDEEEYDQDDEDEEDEEDEEGGFLPIPSKRKRNVGPSRRNKLTETHRGRAEHVFGLFLGQLPEKRTRLEAQDLVIVAKKMGDSLSLTEAEDMVEQAVRLGNEQSSNSQQTSSVSPFEYVISFNQQYLEYTSLTPERWQVSCSDTEIGHEEILRTPDQIAVHRHASDFAVTHDV